MSRTQREGLLLVLLAGVSYAFLSVFIKNVYAFSELRPTDIGVWRFIVATPIIWLIIGFRSRSSQPVPRLTMLSLGFFYAMAALCIFVGLNYISASTYIVITFTYPALIALYSWARGVPLPLPGWVALALTLTGVFLTVPDLNTIGTGNILGIGVAVASVFFVALYYLIGGPAFAKTQQTSLRASGWVLNGCALIFISTVPFLGLNIPPNWQTWLSLLGMSLVSTALATIFINTGISKLGAARASIISTAEPLFTIVLAQLLLNEVMTPLQWTGAVLIVIGVIVLQFHGNDKSKVRAAFAAGGD